MEYSEFSVPFLTDDLGSFFQIYFPVELFYVLVTNSRVGGDPLERTFLDSFFIWDWREGNKGGQRTDIRFPDPRVITLGISSRRCSSFLPLPTFYLVAPVLKTC